MGAVAEGKLRLLWHYRFPTESSRGAAWAVGEDGTPPQAHDATHRVLGGGASETREVRASPLRGPPTNSSLLSLSPLLVPELISLLGHQLSWCLPHAGHCSGTVEGGGGPDGTPSHLARGEVQEGGDFQCSGILALRDRTEGAWTVRMGKGTLRQAKLGRGRMGADRLHGGWEPGGAGQTPPFSL